MPTTMTMDELMSARGTSVHSTDGEWIGLGTGFFGTKRVLVPVKGAEFREDAIYVPYSKDQVKETPDIDSDDIGQETEAELYAHYGLDYSERRSGTGLPEG